ncbi:hypothetical protein MMC10_002976 [Thelotrema lepadinum]|nr:hypothetical protein [Thelotrema lepadinum]
MNQIRNYTSDTTLMLRTTLASEILLWCTLYLVKASFLALTWTIFNISLGFRRAWWFVTIYTFITFWPIFFSALWQCGSHSDYDNIQACNNMTAPLFYPSDVMKIVFHLTSELLILALPLVQIRKLQMSRTKRMSVAAVFILITIDIVSGIIRNAASIGSDFATDDPQLCLCMNTILQVVEPSIAVIVCAMPAYRVILPSSPPKPRSLAPISLPVALLHNAAGVSDEARGTPISIGKLEDEPAHVREIKRASTV